MPLTLNVGLSKKVGLPDYGSLGVSCSVQVELDATLLLNDADGFQHKVRQAYLACHQAVHEELLRQQSGQPSNPGPGAMNNDGPSKNGANRDGQPQAQTRLATASQSRA